MPKPLRSSPTGPGYRLMMLTDNGKVDMLVLADACVDLWRAFLDGHGLASTVG